MSHLLTHPDKIKGRGGVGAFLRILPSERPYFYDNDIFGGEDIRRGLVTARPECSIIKKGGGHRRPTASQTQRKGREKCSASLL